MSDLRQQPIPGMRQPDAPTLATEADAVARLAQHVVASVMEGVA